MENDLSNIISSVENILTIIANIIAIILPIIGLRTNIQLEPQIGRKQSELKDISCALETTTNKGEIKKQIALLKNCLDHRGLFEKNKSQNDKYIWDQIRVIENCGKKPGILREVRRLVKIIHVKIYELQEWQKVDKNKKNLLYGMLIGEILAVLIGFFVQKSFDDSVRDKCISLMVLYYNFMPVFLGIGLFMIKQNKRKILRGVLYILLWCVFIVVTGFVFFYNDKIINIYSALSFGTIVATVNEIPDFSAYAKTKENVENYINMVSKE